jgi:hypothetical protein
MNVQDFTWQHNSLLPNLAFNTIYSDDRINKALSDTLVQNQMFYFL